MRPHTVIKVYDDDLHSAGFDQSGAIVRPVIFHEPAALEIDIDGAFGIGCGIPRRVHLNEKAIFALTGRCRLA